MELIYLKIGYISNPIC